MSALLQCDRSDAWSGRLAMPLSVLPPPIAEPVVLVRDGHKSLVFAAGALKEGTALKLAGLVLSEARRPEVRIVYVAIAVQGGRLGSLRTCAQTLTAARRHAGVITYLAEVAYGPALWLAYQTDLVFAEPSCSIGWLECFDDAGEFDCQASMGMVLDLAELNARLDRQQWARLLQIAVNGEQAEATGIIGGLKRDVFQLSGIDPNSWGPQL
jgi:hypothetical protein